MRAGDPDVEVAAAAEEPAAARADHDDPVAALLHGDLVGVVAEDLDLDAALLVGADVDVAAADLDEQGGRA